MQRKVSGKSGFDVVGGGAGNAALTAAIAAREAGAWVAVLESAPQGLTRRRCSPRHFCCASISAN